MDYFRKFLTYLRKSYNLDPKKFFIRWGSIALSVAIAGILVDIFVPFGAWWNLIRTAILLPLSVAIFATSYGVSLILHYMKRTDPNWKPYRSRFSPMWRRRISAIAGALILVMLYASGESPIYTLVASIALAFGYSLLAFMRQTTQELKREKLGIPDVRDVNYDSELQRIQEKKKAVLEERQKIRNAKKESKKNFRPFRPLGSSTAKED